MESNITESILDKDEIDLDSILPKTGDSSEPDAQPESFFKDEPVAEENADEESPLHDLYPEVVSESDVEPDDFASTDTEDLSELNEISEIETEIDELDNEDVSGEDIREVDNQIDVLQADLSDDTESELPGDLFIEEKTEWEPDFDLLGRNIDSLSTGIDLPAGIFSLAVNSFGIKSGIFLTYESESGYFSPFSSLSIDETSLRRCIIHTDILKQNNLIFGGSTIHSSIDKSFLKDYLSKRFWDLIDNVDLLIFNYHDRFFGMLLIFNLDICQHPQFFDFASFFTRKCSEVFYNSRSKIISSLPDYSDSIPVPDEDVLNEILVRVKNIYNSESGEVKLVLVDYSEIIEQMIKHDSMLDRFRFENDIFRMYSSMLFGPSFIFKINGGKIVLSFAAGPNSNKSLVRHQMSASFLSLFEKNHLNKQPIVFVEDFNPYDYEIESKISEFLSDKI